MANVIGGIMCHRALARGACVVALALASSVPSSARAAAARPQHDLYEWHPQGEDQGPELMLEDKLDLTGKFAVQCQKTWVFVEFGGGFQLDTTSGALSGSVEFPKGSVGIGSSFRGSEVNWYDFKSGGPLQATLAGQATAAAAIGTLSLKLYTTSKPRGHTRGKSKAKPKKKLSASCEISFDAPNLYAPQAPGAPEAEPQAEASE